MKNYNYNKDTGAYDIAVHEDVVCNPLNKTGEKPIKFSLIIRCKPKEETTQGGIIITDSAAERDVAKAACGVIVDIGDRAFEDVSIKPEIGDIVTFKPFRAHDVVFNEGEPGEYRMLAYDHVISVKANMNKEDLSWGK